MPFVDLAWALKACPPILLVRSCCAIYENITFELSRACRLVAAELTQIVASAGLRMDSHYSLGAHHVHKGVRRLQPADANANIAAFALCNCCEQRSVSRHGD